MLRKQRERGVFVQNTRTQIHFRDSLFVGKISINPCCSAGKETKKLLASVSTSASREWLLVEVAGVTGHSDYASKFRIFKHSTLKFGTL